MEKDQKNNLGTNQEETAEESQNEVNLESKKETDDIQQEETAEESQNEVNLESKKETNDIQQEEIEELSLEEKIQELEDKLKRSFAEMENQRRRFEKEKNDAFDYGGFAFAREALNLIDNLERSKQSLINDSSLKDSSALKLYL